MATSKLCAGTFSTGQPWPVLTTTAGTDGKRSAFTIAAGKPRELFVSRVFGICTSVCESTPGVSAANADFSCPSAVEHDGLSDIGYTQKHHIANELAVISVIRLEKTR